MHDNVLNDENIGWPSYVDFLATFAFVLIMFVTWSINLIAGVEREQAIRASLEKMKSQFIGKGFEAVIEGDKLRIPLSGKVTFPEGHSLLNAAGIAHLQEAGQLIALNPDVKRIIVVGFADKVQPKHDIFRNWTVSVERAETVLEFLYRCTNCGYQPEDIRPKLVLHGAGDLDSQELQAAEQSTGKAGDRRVDIVLDKGYGLP